jgi:malonate-semialdehyde dehydrogenase (acetylating)/methylmalonate-semialdehyde dehydrogenase
METINNFINGQRSESQTSRFGKVYNPATGQQTKQVVLGQASEVEDAIEAAATWCLYRHYSV